MFKRGVGRFTARLPPKPGTVEYAELEGCLRFALPFALEDKADKINPLIRDLLDWTVART